MSLKETVLRGNPARLIYDQAFGSLAVDRKVYLALGTGFLLLAVTGIIAYRSLEEQQRTAAAVSSAQAVLGGLQSSVRSLEEAESAQRAWILTSDPAELEGFREAAAATLEELDQVSGLAMDDGQRAGIAATRPLIEQRLRSLEEGVEFRRERGLDAAAERVRVGAGRPLMREVRRQFFQLAAREEEIVAERTSVAADAAAFAERAIVAALLIALALFGAAAWVIGRELRERHAAEAAASQLASIVESTGDAIFSTEPEGEIVTWNAAAERMSGYAAADMYGVPAWRLVPDSMQEGLRAAVEHLREGREVENIDSQLRHADGSVVDVALTVSPIRLGGGRILGWSVIARDITAKREVERLKNEFVSVVSHELRTPLTSIRGALGLLSGGLLGTLPPKGQRMLEVATANTDRLIRLINDILDVEKLESGSVTMELRPVPSAELIESAVDAMRGLADKSGVYLVTGPGVGRVMADADPIVQVLTNLVSNAIKFSHGGDTVTLSAERAGDFVQFSVADTGRGIPPDKLETIFERFQQVDASDAREKGGTGLGLAISRHIVLHHGGRIWAESQPGHGATFHFTLPAAAQLEPAAPSAGGVVESRPTPAAAVEGPLVLICDDDRALLGVVRLVLERRGYRVIEASNGRDAVELAARHRPAAVLLDLVMPDYTGWDTLAALKSREETRDTPVVIFSGLGPDPQSADAQRAEAWVLKGTDHGTLLQVLDQQLRGESRRRVLIVEDDADLARILCATFEQHGYESMSTGSGQSAIEVAQGFGPQLLVLDLALADGDGGLVVDWMRRHRLLRDVPLIVYTGRDLSDADRHRLSLGRTELLTKSRATPEELAERAAVLLGLVTDEGRRE